MGLACMSGGAGGGIVGIHGKGMLLDLVSNHVMQVSIVEIIHMALVDDALMATVCPMGVGGMIMIAIGHEKLL